MERNGAYSPGTLVAVRNDQSRVGTVREVRTSSSGDFDYLVFFGIGQDVLISGRDLVPVNTSGGDLRLLEHEAFLARLGLSKIRNKLTDSLFSVQASRTHLEPYQFKPVLQFLANGRRRLILADEVGLGKTIEAGLILTELAARESIRRMLIVCPARLREKWRDELYSRFDQQFEILDANSAKSLASDFERYGNAFICKAIIGLETIRSKSVLERFQESFIDFDFAVIDEAPHLRNPTTLQSEAGHVVSERSSSFLMLTATPIQLDSSDLYQLFHTLDPGEFGSELEFDQLQEPNLIINETAKLLLENEPATVRKAAVALKQIESTTIRDRFLGDPTYHSIQDRLADTDRFSIPDLVSIQRDLRSINTLSDFIVRTTKRDVRLGGSHSVQRTPHIVDVSLSDGEKRLYESILKFARAEYLANNPSGRSSGFATVQRERQAASCLPAVAEYLGDWIKKADTKLGFEGVSDEEVATDDSGVPVNLNYSWSNDLKYEKARSDVLIALQDYSGSDVKLEALIKILEELKASSPNAKVILFSTFKRTLLYLKKQITATGTVDSDRVFHIDGDVDITLRPAITDRFKNTDGFSLLLMSEVGAEGLDYQFSDTLINYDLPWNPMRVEQRIGRLDRYGQESDRIRIYSFVLQETIEERVLARLYQRINIFEESIGDLAPILGQPLAELEKLVFSAELTGEELERRAEQVIVQIENEKHERDVLWESKDALFHQELLLQQEAVSMLETGKYLSPLELKCIVTEYIESSFPGSTVRSTRSDEVFTLTVSRTLTDFIQKNLGKFDATAKVKTELGIEFAPLKRIPLVFSGEAAQRRQAAKFINIRHPFAVEAIKFFETTLSHNPEKDVASLVSRTWDRDSVGDYSFFIYSMSSLGHEHQSKLIPIVLEADGHPNEQLEARLLEYLITADARSGSVPEVSEWDEKTNQAILRFSHLRDQHEAVVKQRNESMIDSQQASLEQTYRARIQRYAETMAQVRDPRITRMKSAQIENARDELGSRIDELESRRNVVVTGKLEIAGSIELVFDPKLRDGTRGLPSTMVKLAAPKNDSFAIKTATSTVPLSSQTVRDEESPQSPGSSTPSKRETQSSDETAATGSALDDALRYAQSLGLEILDRSQVGGSIWIVDEQHIARRLRNWGFSFAKNGGRVTKRRPAWYLDQQSLRSRSGGLQGLINKWTGRG